MKQLSRHTHTCTEGLRCKFQGLMQMAHSTVCEQDPGNLHAHLSTETGHAHWNLRSTRTPGRKTWLGQVKGKRVSLSSCARASGGGSTCGLLSGLECPLPEPASTQSQETRVEVGGATCLLLGYGPGVSRRFFPSLSHKRSPRCMALAPPRSGGCRASMLPPAWACCWH